jgi:hypothetical protein
MIDYFSHAASLQVAIRAIRQSPAAGTASFVDSAEAQPGSALLGALVDHLLQYSQTETSVEIGILSHAAALFKDGRKLLNQITEVFSSLEAGMTNPGAPGVLTAFNKALSEVPNITTGLQNLGSKLDSFQASSSPVDWMTPVGRQQGHPVAQWFWRDVFLARRTTAFVEAAKGLAITPRQQAFALGTVAGAAGNLLGSGYLNAVVGGPRRSHQLRHRLAAYSVGVWFREQERLLSGGLDSIREALSFGQQGTLSMPADLKTLAQQALQTAYPSGTAVLPDLDAGYGTLMEHLSLLGDFTVPPAPAPMNNAFLVKVLSAGLTPGTVNIQDDPTSTGGSGGTIYEGGGSSHMNAGQICGLITALILAAGLVFLALVSGTGPNQNRGVPTVTTTQQLETLGNSPDVITIINSLYGAALLGWQALAAARLALVLRGLLYPEPDDLSNPTFKQFLSIPSGVRKYPLLSMPSSDDGLAWPTSAPETPTTLTSRYSAAASPLIFLNGDPIYSVSALSPRMWTAVAEFTETGRNWGANNYDLDSDRGFLEECWALIPGTSITNPPVHSTILSFNGI